MSSFWNWPILSQSQQLLFLQRPSSPPHKPRALASPAFTQVKQILKILQLQMADWCQLDISFVNEKWVGMKWLHPYLSDSGRSVQYFSLPATILHFILMQFLFYFHLAFFNYVFCQFWLLLVGSHVPFIISNHCPPKFTTAYQSSPLPAYQCPDILAAGPPDQGRDPYFSSSKQPWTTITRRQKENIYLYLYQD